VADDQTACQPIAADLDQLIERAQRETASLSVQQAQLDEVDAEISRSYFELVPGLTRCRSSMWFGGGNQPDSIRLGFSVAVPLLDWHGAEREALQANGRGSRSSARPPCN